MKEASIEEATAIRDFCRADRELLDAEENYSRARRRLEKARTKRAHASYEAAKKCGQGAYVSEQHGVFVMSDDEVLKYSTEFARVLPDVHKDGWGDK